MKRYLAILIFFTFLYSQGTHRKKIVSDPVQRSASKVGAVIDRKYADHTGNRILNRFYNFGGIGDGGGQFSGIYPIGSGNSYFYEFTPVIAASVVDSSGNRKHIVSDGAIGLRDMSPFGYQWGFEPLPGFANPNQDYMAINTIPESWPESWPNREEDWNGYWNGAYGKYVRADQESYYVMNDQYNDEFFYFPFTSSVEDSVKRGLGIKLDTRIYQWNHPAAEDIIIITYLIENVSDKTLDSVVFGMYGDADIGSTNGDFSDDDAYFDVDNDIVYQWDHDGWSAANGGFVPAYFGWAFLESPGNPTDGIDNDGDGMIDESQFDGIDNDSDWLADRDDIGADGLGTYHLEYIGPDEDGSEGNGVPDVGEPNFEITDNDESDQIGLTSFYSASYPSIRPDNDEVMWGQLKPGVFQVPNQNIDQTFLYGSAYITLLPGEKKKFAIAMVFGNDMADILRNTTTMQNIYDNDYSFAKPPLKPSLTVVPGDRQVTLYWDDFAEKSMDPVYGMDFEGYRVYRSTDAGFIDAYTVTDAYGNITFKKPLVIYDVPDSLRGPHPVGFNGLQFDMGEDSGLKYSYVDSSDVINGQKYYYAVTAYDKGYDLDFYQLGFSERENLLPIAPSECSIILDLDLKGNVVRLSQNAGVALPNAAVAGYVPPNTLDDPDQKFISHIEGDGTGDIGLEVVDPYAVLDNHIYNVVFNTLQSEDDEVVFSVLSDQEIFEAIVLVDSSAKVERNHIDTSSVVISSVDGSVEYVFGVDYTIDPATGFLTALSSELLAEGQADISYKYFPLYQSSKMNGEISNPIFDGMRIKLQNHFVGVNYDSTGWLIGETNYRQEITAQRLYPADFHLIFEGNIGDSVTQGSRNVSTPFRLKNVTDNDDPNFRIFDYDRDDVWDPDEPILIQPYDGNAQQAPYMFIRFYQDSLDITSTVTIDTLITETDTTYTEVVTYDTAMVEIVHAKMGDIYRLATYRPFSKSDTYEFTTTQSRVNKDSAKTQLNDIAVVPNPYVVAASWEPRHVFTSGRGPRKLDFINLPSECTIKIFTLSGYLIDTIEHQSGFESGAASWDLLSKDGLEIAYGIYIYHIDAPGIGETTGKFAVIK
jgi:hypothetical protein